MDEDYGHRGQEQKRPLRKTRTRDEDLAAVANRAFNFAFFNVFNSDRCTLSSNYDTGDNRFGFATRLCWTLSLRDALALWSLLLRAFRRVLGQRVEPQIDNTLSAVKSLDHLVDSYRFSQGGHRS